MQYNSYLKDNIKFLIKLNKDRNGLNRGHFCHELKITRPTLYRWENGGKLSRLHLKSTLDYFNRYLHLKLNTDKIQNEDIEMILKNSLDKVAEPDYNYNTLTKDEIELLALYEQLPEDERIAFIEFLEKMAKSRER
ncbi:MAG: hypothetical protein A2Y94_13850 [Caldithrix sp. RBG_13_44_9]|nr:MAG: hypothetical protein A2Y94_13850 [Caldithrix sp. RBG_13_44_9]